MSHNDLTAEEQALCRRTLPWHSLHIAVDPDGSWGISHAISGQRSGTLEWRGQRGSYVTSSKGIGWAARPVHPSSPASAYDLLVGWPRIRRHLTSQVTGALREAIVDHERRRIKHQIGAKSYPGWTRIPFVTPMTPDGETAEDVDRWFREVHRPAGRVLDAERADLLNKLYPATAPDAEPTDLLELLQAIG